MLHESKIQRYIYCPVREAHSVPDLIWNNIWLYTKGLCSEPEIQVVCLQDQYETQVDFGSDLDLAIYKLFHHGQMTISKPRFSFLLSTLSIYLSFSFSLCLSLLFLSPFITRYHLSFPSIYGRQTICQYLFFFYFYAFRTITHAHSYTATHDLLWPVKNEERWWLVSLPAEVLKSWCQCSIFPSPWCCDWQCRWWCLSWPKSLNEDMMEPSHCGLMLLCEASEIWGVFVA